MDGIRTAVERPLAVRGGVLMIPLAAQRPGAGWPDNINLRMDDASTFRGEVIWIEPAPPRLDRGWTDDPRAVVIRGVRETDDSSRFAAGSGLGPWLVAPLPADGDGFLRLYRQTLRPVWVDRPDSIVGNLLINNDAAPSEILPRVTAPDRPDADAPMEYWRWVLLADRLNATPPPPPGSDEAGIGPMVRVMVARHEADRWRVGLHRLAQASQAVAATCRDLLTRTCADRLAGVDFAAWETDPAATGYLLSRLLDFDDPDRAIIADALAWADSRADVLMWPAMIGPDAIELAIVNAGVTDAAASFQWISAEGDVPVAAELPAGVLTHVRVERPLEAVAMDDEAQPAGASTAASGTHVLEVLVGDVMRRFTVAPPVAPVLPPGFLMQPLRAPLTLHEVRSGQQRVTPSDHATFVQVRRVDRRWEVFIDCRRPGGVAPSQPATLNDFARYRDVRGVEAMTIIAQPNGSPRPPAIITIPEDGIWRTYSGGGVGSFEVHRMSYDDRWLVRIVLADSWISPIPGVTTQLGVMRTHRGSDAVETGPSAGIPWRLDPGRLSLDLTRWDDLPTVDQ